jgi:hypothetical protein
MKKDLAEHYDTSDYPSTHRNYRCENKKVIGKWKDEMNSIPIQEIVALKAKMYSILGGDSTEKQVAKGIPRVFLKRHLNHANYRQCLYSRDSKHAKASTIRSVNHRLYTMIVSKKGLDCNDTKRVVLNNTVDTLPFGHYCLDDEEWCSSNLLQNHQPIPLDEQELDNDRVN